MDSKVEPSEPTDRDLIARAQSGDVAARNALILRHAGLLNKLSRRYRGDSHTREDWRQEAVLGIDKAIQRFDLSRPTKFSTCVDYWVKYSLRVALRSRDAMVRRPVRTKIVPCHESIDGNPPCDSRDGTEAVDDRDELDRMTAAIESLDPLDRWVLDLRHRQGMPLTTIARKMRRHPDTVKRIEAVALTRLRMLMEVA